MKTLVVQLREQRNATLQKYDVITNNPDVYEKIWEEAHGKKISRELKERREGAVKEIEKRVEEIGNAIEQLSSSRENAYGELKTRERALDIAIVALRKVIDEACGSLGSGQYKTSEFLKDLRTPDTYGGYITGVEQYRKNLGMFKGKEKASVDYVLREKHKFDEADKKADEINKAREYLKTLDTQVDALAEQYKTLVLEEWAKENETRKEFAVENSVLGGLPHEVHFRLEANLMKRAGVGKMEGDHWVRPYSTERKNEKFDRLRNLFDRIEEKAGQFIYINNPEDQR